MGMSPTALKEWLDSNTVAENGKELMSEQEPKLVRACRCTLWPATANRGDSSSAEIDIPLIEDAAESLGSWRRVKAHRHVWDIATFSFNGNKVITTAGSMMITNNQNLPIARSI